MMFEPATVDLTDIDATDETFRISTETQISDLAGSISAMGLLHPPMVVRLADGYGIVSGFRRIAACRHLGWSRVPADVACPETTMAHCARVAVADNALQRRLNLIETSRAYRLLERFFPETSEILQAASAVGLADSSAALEKIRPLCQLSDDIQAGLLDETIAFPVALELGGIEAQAACRMAAIFRQLHLSLSRQREMLSLVQEIAAREDQSLLEILSSSELNAIMAVEPPDRPLLAKQVLTWLQHRRYPAISSAQAKRQAALKSLRLPAGIRLIPPAHFEATTFTLSIDFNDIQTFIARKQALDDLLDANRLSALLTRNDSLLS
jgi:ParB family chromosome partitioning protein